MRKIRSTKKYGNVKVKEVNRNSLGILNSYILKTGKPVDFKKAPRCALFPGFPTPVKVVDIQQRAD